MMKRILISFFAVLGLTILILDAQTAMHAARDAIQLCISVIIPSLFPFFVLVNLLSDTMLGGKFRWLSTLERWMHLPSGSGSLYLVGLLGGYPTGAKLVHSAWKEGALDRGNAQRMLAFCSNAGPAFLFGIVGPMFSNIQTVWAIWGIHILSSFGVGCIYNPQTSLCSASVTTSRYSINDAVKKSVSVMGYVCGWILLFRILAGFLNRWFLWLLPSEIQVLLISILELANGCTCMNLIDNEGLRMIIASAAINFGGICVWMQTASITTGLDIRDYLKGKLLQTAFGVGLTMIGQCFLLPSENRFDISLVGILLILSVLLVISLLAGKFTVAFPQKMVYNGVRTDRKG